jgi:penicillin amidase
MRWTGAEPVTEAATILAVNKATDYQEFMNAIKGWSVPPQNFMYADDQGNIAVTVAGKYPTRRMTLPDGTALNVVGSRSLLNGTGDCEWTGSIPFDDVPHALNPEQGYLAGPNQMSVGPEYPYLFLSGWWDPGARARRINDLLRSTEKVTFEDMQRFQVDTYDYFASLFVPKILESASLVGTSDPGVREAVELLREWNFHMRKDEVAPTIWWHWLSAFYKATVTPPYEQQGLIGINYPTPEALWILLEQNPSSKWFNGDFSGTAAEALDSAVQKLASSLGPDMASWTWGRAHELYIRHLSGLAALSEGPYAEDGDAFTLLAAPHLHHDFSMEAYSTFGPSWRIIADLASDGLTIGVYPGGQSGNVASPHYSDELPMWLNGAYHVILHPQTADTFPSEEVSCTMRMVPT